MSSILNFSNKSDKHEARIVNNNLFQIQGLQSRFDKLNQRQKKQIEETKTVTREIDSYDGITIVPNNETKTIETDTSKQIDAKYEEPIHNETDIETDIETEIVSDESAFVYRDQGTVLSLFVSILRDMEIIPNRRIVLESDNLIRIIAELLNLQNNTIEIELCSDVGCFVGKQRRIDSIRITDSESKYKKDLKTYFPEVWNYIKNELKIDLKNCIVSN